MYALTTARVTPFARLSGASRQNFLQTSMSLHVKARCMSRCAWGHQRRHSNGLGFGAGRYTAAVLNLCSWSMAPLSNIDYTMEFQGRVCVAEPVRLSVMEADERRAGQREHLYDMHRQVAGNKSYLSAILPCVARCAFENTALTSLGWNVSVLMQSNPDRTSSGSWAIQERASFQSCTSTDLPTCQYPERHKVYATDTTCGCIDMCTRICTQSLSWRVSLHQ